MVVTLAAGHSLRWFKNTFAEKESFDSLLAEISEVPIGSTGLLFTPYLAGERTPHSDSQILGSFIGMDSSHNRNDFVRLVIEGITFSLKSQVPLAWRLGCLVLLEWLFPYNWHGYINFYYRLHIVFHDVMGADLLGIDLGNLPEQNPRTGSCGSCSSAMGRKLFYFIDLTDDDGIQRRLNLRLLWTDECSFSHFCLEVRA
ncbi:xylulokinase [Cytobacillus firmus DS1]|uniref:Xylulokinase n=1 Tax=Cytobacillus firmus DS1 TaxID=1307436 RepID=W7KY06_CYTFI|nr:xylulokinase [Cytobacillus firmus DS1]